MGATSTIHNEDSQGNGPAYVFDTNNQRDILAHYDDGTEKFAVMSDGFIRTTSGWKNRPIAVGVGDIAADNDDYTFPLIRAKHDITITNINIGVDSDVVADSTDFQTIYLEQTGNTTDIGSLATSSAGFSKHVPRAVTIATSAEQDHLSAGQTLQLRIAKGGSGVAMYGLVISINFTIDQPNSTIGTATDNIIRVINEVGTNPVIVHDHDQRDHVSIRESGIEKLRIDVNGKMHGGEDNIPVDQYYYQTVNVGTISTTDSKKCPLFKSHCDVEIKNIYFGAKSTHAVDSNTAYWQIKINDNSGNMLSDAYIHGPYGGGTALVKGQLYDMGDMAKEFAKLTSSEHIQVEFAETGTGPDIDGLTFVIVYIKTA